MRSIKSNKCLTKKKLITKFILFFKTNNIELIDYLLNNNIIRCYITKI